VRLCSSVHVAFQALTWSTAVPTFVPSTVSVYRINCGGSAFVDNETGLAWSADTFFTQGFTSGDINTPVAKGFSLDYMYRTNRYFWAGSLSGLYVLPCDPGVYNLRLYFANQYTGGVLSRRQGWLRLRVTL
jgi:hypothetical protein